MASAALAPGLREYHFEDAQFTYYISGVTSSTDPATVVGYACSMDTTADGTVKLAADGDRLFGRIEQYEYRAQEAMALVTVSKQFIGNLPLKTGETPARGSKLVGAGNGTVKAASISWAGATDPTAADAVLLGSPFHAVLTYDGTAHTVTVSFGV